MVVISIDGCKNPIIEVIAGKSFKIMDFLKHITYNMKWWNFYGNFIIGMAYTVCLTLFALIKIPFLHGKRFG